MLIQWTTRGGDGMLDRPAMLKVPEAARLLRCSLKTAYKMAAEGTLPTVRVGKQLRVPV
ncbi:MAG: helix-turn-helix domain-containing protein, partial [Bacillota bacterium]